MIKPAKKSGYSAAVIIGLLCTLIPGFCFAQSMSSTGNNFWLGYGAHASMFNKDGSVNNNTGGSQDMRLYLNASAPATVTIEMPLIGWARTVHLKPGTMNDVVVIPKAGGFDGRLTKEGVSDKGIHITSDQPINAFCHLYDNGSSASTLLIPEEILGQEYYTLGTAQVSPGNNSFSWCFVVATQDGTMVEITPSASTLTHPANVPFTQVLNSGQVLNLFGALTGNAGNVYTGVNLTGTRIRTISPGTKSACQKIAVFAGSSNTAISCSDTLTADNLFQQVLPIRAWGQSFITVPTAGMNNTYRVFINTPTKVIVNGKVYNHLVNGQYYEFTSDSACKIAASSPVLVAQYITSAGQCGNTGNGPNGDPEVTYLTPYSFSVGHVLIESPPYSSNITSHYVNIVLRSIAIDSFKIDNVRMPQLFVPFSIDTSYSYAQIPITPGQHLLSIDTLTFTAIAYGYGPLESYAYNTGFTITKLSSLGTKNPYSKNPQATVCLDNQFNIQFTIRRTVDELYFDFENNPALSPNAAVDIYEADPDSVYYNSQDTFYRYTLPSAYTLTQAPSSFNIDVAEFIVTDEGCIERRDITYNITGTPKPTAIIGLTYDSCLKDTLNFKDNSTYSNGGFTNWLWDFGDKTTASGIKNPSMQYAAYGSHTISLRSITGNGCYADTSKTIVLNPKPKPDFNFAGIYCPGNDINFTDQSTIQNGWKIAKRTWNFGDGSATTIQNPVKKYSAGGAYNVKLIDYSDKGCVDSVTKPISMYTVEFFKELLTIKNPLATTDSLSACRATPFNLSATFTIRPVEIQLDFSNNSNLSPNKLIDIPAPVPDSVYFNGVDSFFRYPLAPTFTFSAVASLPIMVTAFTLTKGGCIAQTFFADTIQVAEKPVANWLLTYNHCSNDTLYFKDKSTAGTKIVQWAWSFNDGTTDGTINPVKKYTTYGDYNVSLHIATAPGCFADTVMPVSLSPKPIAGFSITAPLLCANQDISFTDASAVVQPGTLAKWQWDFGNGSTAATQNPIEQYTTPRDFTVTLITGTDHNCADTLIKAVTIYTTPTITIQPDFYIFNGSGLQLNPGYTGTGLKYSWLPVSFLDNPISASPFANPDKDVKYTVSATGDGNCLVSADVTVHILRVIAPPNAFSPNGDGINDKWVIENIAGYLNCTVRVFNRYGQLIFNAEKGYPTPWDGSVNGKRLPVGTYYYIINSGSPQVKAPIIGSLTILY